MKVKRFDVAIVGAGPAGSALAISLARKGYSVVLVDKAFFPREKLCGDFLNPINWPLFEQLGVADGLLSFEHDEVGAFRISTCAGDEARVDFPVQVGRRRFGLGLRRFYLDNLLVQAAEKEGVAVQQGCRVGAVARDAEGWSITLEAHSAKQQLHSVFLIGADGRNSLVAHRLGLARISDGPTDYLAFQLHLTRRWSFPGEVQIHGFLGGYAGLVGLGGGTANLCFTVEKRRAKEDLSLAALLEKFVCRNGFLRECLRESEIVGDIRSAYPVYFSPRRCYGDGFLLVGDAARVTEPVTGEGIYFALQSGILAGEAIDGAFRRRDGTVERFAGYGRLCRQAFGYRQTINRIIRGLIYRPSLLAPLVRFSSKTPFPLRPLVDRLCRS
jgi:geranylgeranyl reductase family protein